METDWRNHGNKSANTLLKRMALFLGFLHHNPESLKSDGLPRSDFSSFTKLHLAITKHDACRHRFLRFTARINDSGSFQQLNKGNIAFASTKGKKDRFLFFHHDVVIEWRQRYEKTAPEKSRAVVFEWLESGYSFSVSGFSSSALSSVLAAFFFFSFFLFLFLKVFLQTSKDVKVAECAVLDAFVDLLHGIFG